ncbi:hypothetical protein BGZ60DRAFT_419170, partial [Tricladium varicosporioides]
GILIYTIDIDISVSRVYSYSILVEFGTSLFAQPELIASAVGFITCAQVSGITIALAIANSIFLNKSQAAISTILPNVLTADIQAAIIGARSTFVASLSNTVKREVLAAIVTSISKTYILVIATGTLTTVLSFAIKRERLFIAADTST